MAPTSLLTAAVVLALAGQSIAEGISLEPASIPKIVSATFSGSGCPSGSVELSAGGEWHWDNWTLNLHRFTAEDGREADQRTRSANCQIQVHLASGPPGWQLAIGEVSARGFASILEGGSMSASATSYWSQEALSSVCHPMIFGLPCSQMLMLSSRRIEQSRTATRRRRRSATWRS
jgi:hypothetical protein